MTLYKYLKVTESEVTSFNKHKNTLILGDENGEIVLLTLPDYIIQRKIQLQGQITQLKIIKNNQFIVITDDDLLYLIDFEFNILSKIKTKQPQKFIIHSKFIILLEYKLGVCFYEIQDQQIVMINQLFGLFQDILIEKHLDLLFAIGEELIIYNITQLKVIFKDLKIQGALLYFSNSVLLVADNCILHRIVFTKNWKLKEQSVQQLETPVYEFRYLDGLYIETNGLIQMSDALEVKNIFKFNNPVVNTIQIPYQTTYGIIPLLCVSLVNNSCVIIDFHNQKQLHSFTPLCGQDLELSKQLETVEQDKALELIQNYDISAFKDTYPLLQFISDHLFITGNNYIQLFEINFNAPLLKEEDSQ